jgi:hypothetical protein
MFTPYCMKELIICKSSFVQVSTYIILVLQISCFTFLLTIFGEVIEKLQLMALFLDFIPVGLYNLSFHLLRDQTC